MLTDIDDTLTTKGRLHATAYAGLEALHQAGLAVIPVTGRPAGWCDLIARQWPVDGVVGENGAFWYRYDDAAHRMMRIYCRTAAQRRDDRGRLDAIAEAVLAAVPGAAISADQDFRSADLAIDFREDVRPLAQADVDRIAAIFEAHGAIAKISSIHVNGWYGTYDKLTTSLDLLQRVFGLDETAARDTVVFVGDSPNDAPMFGYFSNAVGVANIGDFRSRMDYLPRFVTAARGGDGFAEFARHLLELRAT